jgi:glycosyltransferase involved in cell wall biosynthesis
MNVGYIGAMGPDKGVKYLAEAWKGVDHDGILYFFGRDAELNKDYIKYLMGGFNYKNYGAFDSLQDIMSLFQIYVQPSYTEGFGIGVLEAMSYGKTVICSDGAGVHEIIQHGVDGYVFPKGNIFELCKLIRYCIDNPVKSEQVGLQAWHTSKGFGWEAIMENYIYAYEKVRGRLK